MTGNHHKVRIGLFAALTGALFGIVIVVWGGFHLFRHRERYVIELEGTVFGLVKGADVMYEGIPVGAVHSIALVRGDARRVRIEIDVDDDAPIRTDTKATLTFAGITGSKVIDLVAGRQDAPPLEPGGTIALGETTFDKLERELDDVATRSRHLLERADRIAASTETVVSNLARITDPGRVTALVTRSTAAVDDLARTTAEVRALISENRSPIAAAVNDLRAASRSFKELAREVREQPSRLIVSSPRADRRLPR